VKNGDQFLAQLLIPINLNKLKREDELNIYDAYSVDLQTRQQFTLEVKRWKARWELYPTDQVKPKFNSSSRFSLFKLIGINNCARH
jgi:hypothetical protein